MDYQFNSLGRLRFDQEDHTQRNMINTRFSNYLVSNFFTETTSDTHVQFATNQPTINFLGNNGGVGLGGNQVDVDSKLHIQQDQTRAFERLQLNPRIFATIPFLGRGSVDPEMESKLMQGEMVSDFKSSIQSSEQTNLYSAQNYPMHDSLRTRINDPTFSVQESALAGWVRGGINTRELASQESGGGGARPNAIGL